MSDNENPWAEQLAKHPVWASLDSLLAKSGEADQASPDDRGWPQRHAHIERVVEHVRERIRRADPEFVPKKTLDALKSAADGATTALESSLTASRQQRRSHNRNARDQIDELMRESMYLPPLGDEALTKVTRKAVDNLQKYAQEAADASRESIGKLQEEVQQVTSAHQDELQRRDQRLEELDEAIRNLQAPLASLKQELTKAEEEERGAWQEQAKVLMEQLEHLREQASNLVDEKAAEVVSGGYASFAKDQRQQADRWRDRAVAFAMAGATISLLLFVLGGADSVQEAIRTIPIPATLFAIAGYAGKQSSNHRKQSEIAYKATLELAALEPFLSKLPDGEKAEARRVFAAHFFSQPLVEDQGGPTDGDEPNSARQLMQLLRELGVLPKK